MLAIFPMRVLRTFRLRLLFVISGFQVSSMMRALFHARAVVRIDPDHASRIKSKMAGPSLGPEEYKAFLPNREISGTAHNRFTANSKNAQPPHRPAPVNQAFLCRDKRSNRSVNHATGAGACIAACAIKV
jgi:hypothetical protein